MAFISGIAVLKSRVKFERSGFRYLEDPVDPERPLLATLLASLQKAKSFEAQPQADGRVALKMSLAKGGTQTSFCSKDEHKELESLLGR